MRRKADTRTDLDAPETPLTGDIAACSLAVTCAKRHDSARFRGNVTDVSTAAMAGWEDALSAANEYVRAIRAAMYKYTALVAWPAGTVTESALQPTTRKALDNRAPTRRYGRLSGAGRQRLLARITNIPSRRRADQARGPLAVCTRTDHLGGSTRDALSRLRSPAGSPEGPAEARGITVASSGSFSMRSSQPSAAMGRSGERAPRPARWPWFGACCPGTRTIWGMVKVFRAGRQPCGLGG